MGTISDGVLVLIYYFYLLAMFIIWGFVCNFFISKKLMETDRRMGTRYFWIPFYSLIQIVNKRKNPYKNKAITYLWVIISSDLLIELVVWVYNLLLNRAGTLFSPLFLLAAGLTKFGDVFVSQWIFVVLFILLYGLFTIWLNKKCINGDISQKR